MAIPVPGRIAEALRKSTVQIRSGRGHREGNGSGVVIAPEQIVTNAHVMQGERPLVESWEGKTVGATLIKVDERRDLALLAVPGFDGAPVTLGDSSLLRPGTPVLAIGNPLGFVGALSSGVVHSVGRPPWDFRPSAGSDWICADLRLAPGNSGGPLADFLGHVMGINTMVASGGLALAIPSRVVQAFLSRPRVQATLGVVGRPVRLRQGQQGILVLEVLPGTAAETASLLPGDILAKANEKILQAPDDLVMAVEQSAEGLLRLDFYRGRQDVLRHVTARIRPEPARSAA